MDTIVEYGGFKGQLEETSCPICGDDAPRKLIFRDREIGFYVCEQCNLQFASPRFTETSMLNIYNSENFTSDYRQYRDWNFDQWVAKGDRSYTVSLEKVNLVKEYLPGGSRILDVGCSVGQTVLLANKCGLKAEGIEPGKELADIALNSIGAPVHNMQIQDFPVSEPYDGIIIWDVLEHLYNPLEVIQSCSDRLRDGGFLFAQIPNHRGLGNRSKEFLCRKGLRKTFKHFGFPWHVYSFDRQSLTHLFKKTGLAPLRFESWSGALMDARNDPISRISIYLAKKLALSDYITVVAVKKS